MAEGGKKGRHTSQQLVDNGSINNSSDQDLHIDTGTKNNSGASMTSPPSYSKSSALPAVAVADSTSKSVADDGAERAGRRKSFASNSLPLFVFNVSAVLLFWMIGAVYTGGVVRTLERRFGLSSSQTGLIMTCSDLTHTCIVVFVGYFGRRANKPRMLCVTTLFSALAGLLMASPHWLFDPPVPAADAVVTVSSSSSQVDQYNNTIVGGGSARLSLQFCAVDIVGPSWGSNSSSNQSRACEHQTFATTDTVSATAAYSGVHPAFYLFIVAQLLNGIGGSGIHTLSLAYIDENASKVKSSLYIGVVASMYAFGPVCGLMLAALTLRLPENLTRATSERLEDPSWIGCWWLGYLLCAVGILVTAIPLWMFPTTMKNSTSAAVSPGRKGRLLADDSSKVLPAKRTDKQATRDSIMQQIKEFPRSLLHLLRNKPYVVNLGTLVCGAYVIMGIFVNMVRYIEIHFHQQAFVASTIAALVSALTGAIGGFAGGILMSKLRLKPPSAIKLMILATTSSTVGLGVVLLLDCPQVQVAGRVDPLTDRLSVHDLCNSNCQCSTSRKSFSPVCGDDNLTYFSSCFAGCTDFSNGTYIGCRCVLPPFNFTSTTTATSPEGGGGGVGGSADELGMARPGLCLPPCNLIVVYAVTMFLSSLIGSLARVPSTIVNFRIVDDDERSFALAVNSFVVNIAGFVPAPLLFGALIDSSCRLWQQAAATAASSAAACPGSAATELLHPTTTAPPRGGAARSGSCLLFDTAKFRQRTYGVAFGVEIIEIILVVTLYRLIRHRHFDMFEKPVGTKEAEQDEKSPDVLETMVTKL
jgi:sodium-independent organic anion transporter